MVESRDCGYPGYYVGTVQDGEYVWHVFCAL